MRRVSKHMRLSEPTTKIWMKTDPCYKRRRWQYRVYADIRRDSLDFLLVMPTRSRIRAFNCCQNQRPWVTLMGHYALCFKTHASFGAHHEILNEDRPILSLSATRCSPMTLASDNIRIMRIFARVPWRRGVKRQWDNRKRRKRRFSGLFGLRLRHLRKWGQR